MKKKLKKTTLALFIINFLPLFIYASTEVNVDGSFTITDIDGGDFLNSDDIKDKVTKLLADTSLNKTNLDTVISSGNYYPVDSSGNVITENNVIEITSTPSINIAEIYGGYCSPVGGDCVVKNANIVISGDTVMENLPYGAYSYYESDSAPSSMTLTGNVYLMDNARVEQEVYGAYSSSSPSPSPSLSLSSITAIGNVYLMDNAKINYGVYGAVSTSTSSSVTATGNVYLMDNAQVNYSVYGANSSSSFSSSTIGNVYVMDNVKVEGIIFGGNSSSSSSSATTIGNVYVMDNAQVEGPIYAGMTVNSPSATAIGNAYLTDNAKVEGAVYGAYTFYSSSILSSMTATGNVYLMDNVQVEGDVVGAYYSSTSNSNSNSSYSATGSVYIYGNVKIQDTAELWGTYNTSYLTNENFNIFSRNLLSVGNSALTVKSLGNFENYNFYLNDYNKDVVNDKDSALLTVTDSIKNDDTVIYVDGVSTTESNVSSAKIEGISGENIVNVGDEIVLINANGAMLNQGANSTQMSDLFGETPVSNTVTVGLARKANIEYEISNTNNTVIATIKNISMDADAIKPLAEGRLAGIQNVTRGADLLLNVMRDNRDVGTFTPIAVISGGVNKYQSGSHIDTRDYRLVVGSRYQLLDNLFAGLTLEYGRSNYDTYNSSASGDVNGDGHTYNYGLSLFAKYTQDLELGQAYVDGSFRFGRTNTEFQSSDLVTGSGDLTHYKSKVNYFGAHIGTGFIYTVNDKNNFDSSVRYLWTRLGSDSVVLDGDKVDFQKSTSSRVQLKEQYNYQSSENITLSLAGIYEYEFNGKAKTSFSGVSIDAPSVKGSTGIMELGIRSTPIADNKDLKLDFNFRGYGGKRDGVSATVVVQYDF